MSNIEQLVKGESLDDIVTVFALIKAPPYLDMMISRYKPETIRHGKLQLTYTRLFEKGVLEKRRNGIGEKRP